MRWLVRRTGLVRSFRGLLLFVAACAVQAGQPADLRTVAEKSEYRATARYAEVVELLDAMDHALPHTARWELGNSGEGRSIPVLVVANPPVSAPDDLRREHETSGRLVILAIGNIHAGEVDGKEALPMVARELVAPERASLLKEIVFIVAPIYNCDGNERVSRENRPGQNGPIEGMGRRETAAGLDLNRDFIKLDATETRALVAAFQHWDPDIFIDTHTTNGSYHRYLLTWEGPKSPAGDARLIEFVREELFPATARIALDQYDVPTFVYGDFEDNHTRWVTYPAHARYGTTYFGLRGRISVLTEGYSYAPYRERVRATRDFVLALLEYAAAHREKIRGLLREVDRCARIGAEGPEGPPQVAIVTESVAASKKQRVAGFVEEQRDGKSVSTGIPRDYEVELWTHFRPVRMVAMPRAYAVPRRLEHIIATLRVHGVELREPTGPAICEIEQYEIESVKISEKPYQGRHSAALRVRAQHRSRTLDAEYVLVPTAQRLGRLAVYLLEPECEDGLAAWNFFGEELRAGGDYPILRVLEGCIP